MSLCLPCGAGWAQVPLDFGLLRPFVICAVRWWVVGGSRVLTQVPSGRGRVSEFLWGLAVSGRFPWAPSRCSYPPGPPRILGSVFLWRCFCWQKPPCTRKPGCHFGHPQSRWKPFIPDSRLDPLPCCVRLEWWLFFPSPKLLKRASIISGKATH